MRIANVYGLKYASPKTAESTVLYHLKRNGIARRDAADHVRKVSPAMVEEWTIRYENGESLKQIAGGNVDAVTVWKPSQGTWCNSERQGRGADQGRFKA